MNVFLQIANKLGFQKKKYVSHVKNNFLLKIEVIVLLSNGRSPYPLTEAVDISETSPNTIHSLPTLSMFSWKSWDLRNGIQ
jgi:hypothetical protein